MDLPGFVSPPLCGICAAPALPKAILCPTCKSSLAQGPGITLTIPGIDRAWAARPYTGTPRQLITHLKFSARPRLAREAAKLIAAEAPASVLRGTLVPVPPAPLRRLWRGFDPAEDIATALARLAGLPLDACLRRPNARRQVGRSRRERIADPPRVRSRRPAPPAAVLVDDVSTTGATLAACAAALRRAGARDVRALVFAATPTG